MILRYFFYILLGFLLLSSCTQNEGVSVTGNNHANAANATEGHKVGGTVKGEFSDELKLQLNNQEILTINDQSKTFNFSRPISNKYFVKIYRQPSDAQCVVSNGYGDVSADVRSVEVSCTRQREASALTIAQIDVAQTLSHPIDSKEDFQSLVAGRKALVRAYVYAPASFALSPSLTLTVNDQTQAMTCPSTLLSNIPSYPIRSYDKRDTCYASIDADQVKSGLLLTVNAEGTSLQAKPKISKRKTLNLVMVPLTLNHKTPTITDAKLAELRKHVLRTMPFSEVHITKRSAWNTGITNFTLSRSNAFVLEKLLQDLEILRLLEISSSETDTVYFGILPISTLSSGAVVSGLAYCNGCNAYSSIRSFSAIGLDLPDTWSTLSNPSGSPGWSRMILHELGHTLSLLHAPCIDDRISSQVFEGSKDELFPYSGGGLGETPLYDQATQLLINPSGKTDLMGYCMGEWLSDYHAHKINQFTDQLNAQYTRDNLLHNTVLRTLNSSDPEKLLISGKIKRVSGKLQVYLQPIQTLQSNLVPSSTTFTPNGHYQLRVTTREGRILDYTFDAVSLADGLSDSAHFFLMIPQSDIVALIIRENHPEGQTLSWAFSKSAGNSVKSLDSLFSASLVTINEQHQNLEVRWDHIRYPWLQLMHVESTLSGGEKRSVLAHNTTDYNGMLTLNLPVLLPPGGHWEVSLSNGLQSVVQQVQRKKR